jgi:hypothetical protein
MSRSAEKREAVKRARQKQIVVAAGAAVEVLRRQPLMITHPLRKRVAVVVQ